MRDASREEGEANGVGLEPMRYPAPGEVRGLADVGKALRDATAEIMAAYAARLSSDPAIPYAADLALADLEDHASGYLIDVAQTLIALDQADAHVPNLLRDGMQIHALISRLHGAQRAQLGWTRNALRRDFAILREETTRAVRAAAPPDADLDASLRIIDQFLDHAERISQAEWHRSPPADSDS